MSKPYSPPKAWRNSLPYQRALHLFNSYEPRRATELCEQEGIEEKDIAVGFAMHLRRVEQSTGTYRSHGSPEFGSHGDAA